MTTTLEPTRNSYTQEEIDLGLTALAWCGGNAQLAHRKLKDAGQPIPERTLRDWTTRHKDSLERVTETILPQLQERVAAGTESIALALIDLEAQAMAKVQDTLDELKPGEAAAALRNITTSKGINVDKALLLRGRPTQIVQRQDAGELLRQLAIDSTATEIGSGR